MAEIYGHRWTSAYGDNPNEGAALTWAKGLAGITTGQLADGLRACIAGSDDWPPTLPAFRAMCLSIPSFAEVRLETGPTRSLFTALVWQYVDGYAHRQASLERADKLLRDGYELAREHVMRGGALPGAVAGAIEQEKREVVVASPEVVAARTAEIEELLRQSGRKWEPGKPAQTPPLADLAATERELAKHYGKDVAIEPGGCAPPVYGKDAAAGPDA